MATATPRADARAVRATTAQDPTDNGWHSIDWAAATREVERLQQRIFRASQQGQWTKVRDLQKLLLRSRSNLVLSVRQVTQVNAGKKTPGVDGRVALDAHTRGALVYELQASRSHRPRPARRVYIPKANGKLRPLGIPTIADRVRQHVVKTALEPAWEPHFEAHSYGFRPGRRTMDAAHTLWRRMHSRGKARWVLDADIRGAFDHISHAFILRRLGNFPARHEIARWLTAGYVEIGTLHQTTEGTPQGGVISPLLANVALDGLEKLLRAVERRMVSIRYYPNGYFGFARFADDFVVTAPHKERLEEVLPIVRAWLAERGLELNEEKTRITPVGDGFDFLGFTFRKLDDGKCLVVPQKEKVLAKLREFKAWLRHNKNTRPADAIAHLNPRLRGWANYYRFANSSDVYSYVDHRVWAMTWAWAIRRHPRKGKGWVRNRYYTTLRGRDWTFFGETTDRRGDRIVRYLEPARLPHANYEVVTGNASPMDATLADYWRKRRQRLAHVLYEGLLCRLGDRQGWRCGVCHQDLFNGEAVDAHHLIRVTDGGPDHHANRELRHESCHYNADPPRRLRAHSRRAE